MGAYSPVHWLIVTGLVVGPLWLLSLAVRKRPSRKAAAVRSRGVSRSVIDNPYAPPQSEDDESRTSEPELLLTNASQSIRLVNSLIDTIALALLSVVFRSPIANFLAMLVYFWSLEAFFGVTFGKLVTGTRVVTVAGGQPTAWQVLGRTLIRFVPFEAFSFMSKNPVGWHDRWSGTRVIRRQ